MSRNILIIIWLMVHSMMGVAQQNLQFSQYIFNGLSVNPAYAGYKEDWYLNAIYRKQWTSLQGAPQTGAVSVDGITNAAEKRVGVGLQFRYDKLGPQQTLSFYGSYAYRIPLDEADGKRLCFGIGVGASQYSIDGTALKYLDADDNAIPIVRVNQIIPDLRFGIYYYTPNYYLGLSAMDLISEITDASRYNWRGNDYSTIRKTRHYYFTAGMMIDLSDNVAFKPSLMVKEDFKAPTNLDVNASFLLQHVLWLGASWRTGMELWKKGHVLSGLDKSDAFSFMVEIYASENFRIGYAYDYTYNGLSNYAGGSHEISLGVLLSKKTRIVSPRYF